MSGWHLAIALLLCAVMGVLFGLAGPPVKTPATRCRLIISADPIYGGVGYGGAQDWRGVCRLHRADADCEADLDRLCPGWRR